MDQQNYRAAWLKKNTAALLMGAAVLLLLIFGALLSRTGREAAEEPSRQVGGAEVVRVRDGAEVMQTLTYSRCEHTVTRRVTAPVELYGKTLEEVKPLYPDWQITGFSAQEVAMARRPDLFCPAHLVLMTDDAGNLCVYRNKYGEALALEKTLETDVSTLPAAVREELAYGIGFGTEEALAGWLESVES
jgi:hypothetical protein